MSHASTVLANMKLQLASSNNGRRRCWITPGDTQGCVRASCPSWVCHLLSLLSVSPPSCERRRREGTAKVAARRSGDHVATLASRHLSQSSLVTYTPALALLAFSRLSLSFSALSATSLSFQLSKISSVSSSPPPRASARSSVSDNTAPNWPQCFLSFSSPS